MTLLASACAAPGTFPSPFDDSVAACSVAGGPGLSDEDLAGPALDRDAFLTTDTGRAVAAFFDGGPGEPEDFVFGPADGFTDHGDLVFAYVDGRPSGWIEIHDGDVRAWGGCEPVRVSGDAVARRWRPATEPSPETTRLTILVDGGACVGKEEEPDVVTEVTAVEIVESDDTVTIATFVRQRSALGGCAGVGYEHEVAVDLERPLDGRRLLDGGLIPPAPPGG